MDHHKSIIIIRVANLLVWVWWCIGEEVEDMFGRSLVINANYCTNRSGGGGKVSSAWPWEQKEEEVDRQSDRGGRI